MTKRNQERVLQQLEDKGRQLNELKAQGKGDSKAADQVRSELKQLTKDYEK